MTTFQLTANNMVAKHGKEKARELAARFEREAKRDKTGREFWHMVVSFIDEVPS